MKFGKLEQNGLLNNNHGLAMWYPLKTVNSFISTPKIVILPFIVIFVSLITFYSKVKIKSRLFLDDL